MESQEIEKGFSLVEIMLAVVILAVVGVVLLNGLISTKSTSDKVGINAQAFADLDVAAQILTSTPFKSCTDLNANPYGAVALPSRVSVVGPVEGMKRDGNWLQCGRINPDVPSYWKTATTNMQRILIRAKYTNDPGGDGRYIRRSIIKFASGAAYGDNYSVKIEDVVNYEIALGPIPGPETSRSGLVLSSTRPGTPQCYEVMASSISMLLEAQITNPCPTAGATVSLKVKVPAAESTETPAIKPGTYSVDVGAFDLDTGERARPATLRVVVKPPMQVEIDYYTQADLLQTPAACGSFANTKSTAPAVYCVVKLKVATNTGTGAQPLLKSLINPGCRAAAKSDAGTTYVNCSFAPPPNNPSQPAETPLRLYLWKEAGTITEPGKFCTGGGSSLYKKNVSITLVVRDSGLEPTYSPFANLPLLVTC